MFDSQQSSSSREQYDPLFPPLHRSLSAPDSFDNDDPRASWSAYSGNERPSTQHSSDSRSLTHSELDRTSTGTQLQQPLIPTTIKPTTTLFISSRGHRKKLVFTTTPFPKTETDDIVTYISTSGYYTSGASKWSAVVHGGLPSSKLIAEETGTGVTGSSVSPVLATVTRSVFWKKMVIAFSDSPGGTVEVNNIPGLWQRGYTFTLPATRSHSGEPKEYKWCGTKMYSKTGLSDLKLVDLTTKQIIATFERKWSFSLFISGAESKDKPNDHGRDPVGCLNIFEQNMPKELNQLLVILTGYCVIEAEHRKRQKEGI